MISALLVQLALGGLSASVSPTELTFGRNDQVQLEITATAADGLPPPNPRVVLRASVGQLSVPRRVGAGRYRAVYTLPKDRFPQVALLLVEVDSAGQHERRWLTLPLKAAANLKIQTKPYARVTATVGAQTLPSVTAGSSGEALVPAIIPPGVATANIQAVDRAGNTSTSALDLHVRPFPLVLAASDQRSASWADKGPTGIELLAVHPNGQPVQDAQAVTASAQAGQLSGSTVVSPGVFHYTYRAPDRIRQPQDELSFSTREAAGPQRLSITLRPGPPARVGVQLEPTAYRAGSGTLVRIKTVAEDAKGNELRDLKAMVTTSLGKVVETSNGPALELPDQFGNRRTVLVQAVAGKYEGENRLALAAGPATTATLALPARSIREGEALEAPLTVLDRFGNRVAHAPVEVVTSAGTHAQVREVGLGQYVVHYQPGVGDPVGEVQFQVRSADTSISTEASALTVLPRQSPWSLSAAVLAVGQTNLAHANGGGPRISPALVLGSSNFQLVADLSFTDYAHLKDVLANSGAPIDGNLQAFSAALGLRQTFPVSTRLALYLCAVAGAARATSQLEYTNAPGWMTSRTTFGFVARGAAGTTLQVGPGDLMLQVEYTEAPASGLLTGNLGGVSVAAGYGFRL